MIHSPLRILTMLALAGNAASAIAEENKLPQFEQGWWQQVAASIARSEYQIHTSGAAESGQTQFHAVNRAQNLRADFSASGITVSSRLEQENSWSIKLSLSGLEQHGALVPAMVAERIVDDRTVTYYHGDIVETFTNEQSGILLHIELSDSLVLDENSALAFQLDTNLEAIVGDNTSRIEFYSSGVRVARLSLKTVSREPREAATARLAGNKLLIFTSRSSGVSDNVQMVLTTNTGEDTQVGPSLTPDWILNEEQPDSAFAFSVASAGDIDGDGFSDVIVGAPDFDIGQPTSAGRALLYRGSANGLMTTPSWTADGTFDNERFGASVSSAGNVNVDANAGVYSDVIIGATTNDRAYIFPGSEDGLLSSPWILEGAGGKFGFSVASAGDLNGDGLDDVVIGAPEFPGGGRTEIFLTPFDEQFGNNPDYCLEPPDSSCALMNFDPVDPAPSCDNNNSQFGYSVASAGHIDNDRIADIIVGAPSYSRPEENSSSAPRCSQDGEVFVFLGKNLAGQAPGICNSTADWCSNRLITNFDEQQGGARIGESVSSAGDVNADGYDDIVVGAPNWTYVRGQDISVSDTGAALVYLSCESMDPPVRCFGGEMFAEAWAAIGILNDNTEERIRFGASVAGGDVNGDGVSDVIVGAPDQGIASSSSSINSGAVYLYLGSTVSGSENTFLPITPTSDLQDIFGITVNTNNAIALRGAAQWSVEGTERGGNLGRVVSIAGDVDGDGFSDILASERVLASVFRSGGYAPMGGYGITAIENVATFVGDINGDGFDDLVGRTNQQLTVYAGTGDKLSEVDSWVLSNTDSDDSVAGAGDVDGDGYADIIVGRPSANAASTVLIFSGGAAPNTSEPWVISAASGTFGSTVSSAGDINGDGFADVIVGDPNFNNGTGKVTVFLGASIDLAVRPDIDESMADWSAVGTGPEARFGHSVSSAGDINADGYSDVIVGAPGNSVDDTGEAFLYLGSLLTPLEALSWIARGSGQPGAEFGTAVASAGDVNGDGFGDVVVGAPGTELFGEADVGRAFAYLGSAAGLSVIEAWSVDGLQQDDRLGAAVGGVGDINADGLSDLVAGAFLFLGSENGVSSTPAWPDENVNLGNSLIGTSMGGGGDFNGDGFSDFSIDGRGPFLANVVFDGRFERYGIPRAPQQWNLGGASLLAPLGILEAISGTSFEIRVKRPVAPGRYGLEWEVKPLGMPFDGIGLQRGALDDLGTELTSTVDQLNPGTPYRWRARILTASVDVPHSPWLSPSGGTQGAHLLTAGARAAFAFAWIGPSQNMGVFADSMPPVFQWHAGGSTSFEIQWSGNTTFSEPMVSSGSLAATGNDIETFIPDATMWLEILRSAQNPDFREAPVFWRITADGSADSETRAFRLAAASGVIVSSPADGQTAFVPPTLTWDANHNERFQIRFSATDFLGEPLLIVADGDDTADSADDFGITETTFTVPAAIWSDVEALVAAGADGTGTVYFAVRGRDALDRNSTSDIRGLRVNATGTAPPPAPPAPTGQARGSGAISYVTLLLLLLAHCVRLLSRLTVFQSLPTTRFAKNVKS